MAVTNRTAGSRTIYTDMNRICSNINVLFGGAAYVKENWTSSDIVTKAEWDKVIRLCQSIDNTITDSTLYTNLNKIEAAIESARRQLDRYFEVTTRATGVQEETELVYMPGDDEYGSALKQYIAGRVSEIEGVGSTDGYLKIVGGLAGTQVGYEASTYLKSFMTSVGGHQCFENIDLSNFNAYRVTDFSEMFSGCINLKTINVEGLITSTVGSRYNPRLNLYRMFYNCINLQSVYLSTWDTVSVFKTSSMFYKCSSLTELNLAGWTVTQVTNADSMFARCSLLRTIKGRMNYLFFYTGSGMFSQCTNLVGGKGTVYSSSHVDYEYAHVDSPSTDPEENYPGYFTESATS